MVASSGGPKIGREQISFATGIFCPASVTSGLTLLDRITCITWMSEEWTKTSRSSCPESGWHGWGGLCIIHARVVHYLSIQTSLVLLLSILAVMVIAIEAMEIHSGKQ